MQIQQNKIYYILFLTCLGGYVWILLSANYITSHETSVCLLKNITGIPCPSCGSTRSVLSLVHGNMVDALYWNPFGFIIMTILIITPLWIIYDIILKRDSLLRLYRTIEIQMQKKIVYFPAITLVVMNWVWNIMKGL